MLPAIKVSLTRPSALLETKYPSASSTGKPVLITAPVAESVFKRRERLQGLPISF